MSLEVFTEMLNHTMVRVEGEAGANAFQLQSSDGTVFTFYHQQDCCESVYIEDVIGDIKDLVGEPILLAEQVDVGGWYAENPCEPEPNHEEYGQAVDSTWYRFATIKGYVTVRWVGISTYYSTAVELRIERPQTN
jgi:hypothetical protein